MTTPTGRAQRLRRGVFLRRRGTRRTAAGLRGEPIRPATPASRPCNIWNVAFLGYHHAQVSIPPGGQVEARRFYGNVLGMPEIPLPASVSGRALLWFAVGDRSLHVSVEDGIDRERTKAHLAYEVDDIADCRRRLLADGRKLVEQPPLAGYDRFHTLDPFGNRLELIGRVANTNPLDGALKRLTIIGL